MLTRPEPSQSDTALAKLKDFVSSGSFGPGDRLPPERELMGSLGLTRTSLRKGLDALEREGVIWRHVGKGTFVASQAATQAVGAAADLGRQLSPVRMVRARLCIEPAIAREAAINASDDALVRINLARDRAREAATWADYESQDDLFHRAIAEASDNLLLLALFDQLNQVGRAVAWGNVVRNTASPAQSHRSFAEHDEIAGAIAARSPVLAHDAMRDHIRSVSTRLFGDL